MCCHQFGRLLEALLPALHAHFEREGVFVEMFVIGWLQTLYLYLEALPEAVRDRVWDVFLFERSWKIFFRLGLALLQRAEPKLLRCSIDSLMQYIAQFPDRELLDDGQLLDVAFGIKANDSVLRQLAAEA